MPTYTYICQKHGTEEVFKPLKYIDTPEYCLECGEIMNRIIVQGHGGSHGQEAAWIRTTNEALTDEWSPKIETRSDLKKREKELGVACIG